MNELKSHSYKVITRLSQMCAHESVYKPVVNLNSLQKEHFPSVPEPVIITVRALRRSCYSPIIDPVQTTPQAAAYDSLLISGHALLIDLGRQVGR